MRNFQISEQQLQQVLNSLGECSAKYVFSAIEVLRNLPEASSQKAEEEEV